MIREIEARELAVKPHGRSVVGKCGIYFSGERAKVNLPFGKADQRDVFCAPRHPEHSLKLRVFFLTPSRSIPHVLRLSADAEIVATIIEAVAVYVINHETSRRARYEPVHVNVGIAATTGAARHTDRPPGINAPRFYDGIPVEDADESEILIINDGDIALSKRNLTHG